MNIFEGVDNSSMNEMAWIIVQMLFYFIALPGLGLGLLSLYVFKSSNKTAKYFAAAGMAVGIYVFISNYDEIYKWLL